MEYVAQYENQNEGYGYGEPKWVWQVRKINAKGKVGAKLPYVSFKTEAEALRHIESMNKRNAKKEALAAMTDEEKATFERIEHAKKLGTKDDPAFECQICGHYHLGYVKRGTLAHHGYQRPGHGYQTQSCYGALRQPLHASCDALPSYIAMLKNLLEREEKALTNLKNNPLATFTIQDNRHYDSVKCKYVTVNKILERPVNFKYDPKYVYQYPTAEYVVHYYSNVRKIELNVQGYKEEIAYQTKKLNGWKANPTFKGYHR